LTSTLDGDQWSASCLGHFIHREIASGTHWIGSWKGPRADLEAMEKRKAYSCRESNPGCPALNYPDYKECIKLNLVLKFSVCCKYIELVRI
jgi:hypothetical protein